MPGYTLTGRAQAPVEDVWKLLFDPSRFPEWWVGIETVRLDTDGDNTAYTVWPDGLPDFPMPQSMRTDRANGRVLMSCQVLDIDFALDPSEIVRIHVEDGHLAAVAGPDGAADVVVHGALELLAELADGTVRVEDALADGRLAFEGADDDIRAFQRLFPQPVAS